MTMMKAKTAEFISASRTPINMAADLKEINKKLIKLHRRARFQHAVIQIIRIPDEFVCAEVWDVAGVQRYIDKLLASKARAY